MNLWIEEDCLRCGKRNLIYDGDPSDLTVDDVDSFKCYHCSAVTHFGDGRHSDDADEGKPHPDDLLKRIAELEKELVEIKTEFGPYGG